MKLIRLTPELIPEWVAAHKRALVDGTLPSVNAEEILMSIEADLEKYLAKQDDPLALGGDVPMPDGTFVRRIPGISWVMWDGEVCGQVGFRWQNGTTDLPETCLGHIGYWVFEWKRGYGYATKALELILSEPRKIGMPYVDLSTDVDNFASQAVIKNNDGALVKEFTLPDQHGGGRALLWRIYL